MLPDEAHIVTIAVRESHRRRGIAELLLIRAIDLARAKEQGLVTLECRVSNHPALALYDKYGFRKVGLRPRYYSDNREDAYVLTLDAVLTRRFREQLQRVQGGARAPLGPLRPRIVGTRPELVVGESLQDHHRDLPLGLLLIAGRSPARPMSSPAREQASPPRRPYVLVP